MDRFDPAWYEQISVRHSRRRFDQVLPESDLLDGLTELCAHFAPFTDQDGRPKARAVLLRAEPKQPVLDDLFSGLLGSYGKIQGAPCALALLRQNDSDPAQALETAMALGYLGEGLILEATRLGLNSCWVTGTFAPDKVADLLELGPDEVVAGLCPLGYAKEIPALSERVISGFLGQMNRKTMSVLAPGYDNWPDWAQEAVAAARLAPSARNLQPWRFGWDNLDLRLTHIPPKNEEQERKFRLDLGIARLHVNLSLHDHGYQAKWQSLDNGYLARVSRLD